jgi:hypothetical protein
LMRQNGWPMLPHQNNIFIWKILKNAWIMLENHQKRRIRILTITVRKLIK